MKLMWILMIKRNRGRLQPHPIPAFRLPLFEGVTTMNKRTDEYKNFAISFDTHKRVDRNENGPKRAFWWQLLQQRFIRASLQ